MKLKVDSKILDLIRMHGRRKSSVAIVSHVSPDGDAICSSLALSAELCKIGMITHVIMPTDLPKYLSWISGYDSILVYNLDTTKKQVVEILDKAELLFILDLSKKERLGDMFCEQLKFFKGKRILIDHHLSPDLELADYCIHNSQSSSTGELVYGLFESLGVNCCISLDTAEAIYTAIVFDTGFFKFDNTSANTLRIASELLHSGVNSYKIACALENSISFSELHFLGYLLEKKLEFFKNNKVVCVFVFRQELIASGVSIDYLDSVIPILMSIKGIEVLILAKIMDNEIRVSFRSKGKVCVNTIAESYFGGGGHKYAAGGVFKSSFDKFEPYIHSIIDKFHFCL